MTVNTGSSVSNNDIELIEQCRMLLSMDLVETARRMLDTAMGTDEQSSRAVWWQEAAQRIAALEPSTHDGLVMKMHVAMVDAERSSASPLVIAALRDYCELHPIPSVVQPPGAQLSPMMESLLGSRLSSYYESTERNRALARRVERQRSRGDI